MKQKSKKGGEVMASSSKCPGVGLERFFKLDSECTEPGAEQFRELWELCSIHCTSWPDFRSLFTTFPGYRILILINIVETILILILNNIFFFDFLSPKIKRNTPFKINKKRYHFSFRNQYESSSHVTFFPS